MERGQIFGLELECSKRALVVKAWFLLQNLHRWGFGLCLNQQLDLLVGL